MILQYRQQHWKKVVTLDCIHLVQRREKKRPQKQKLRQLKKYSCRVNEYTRKKHACTERERAIEEAKKTLHTKY